MFCREDAGEEVISEVGRGLNSFASRKRGGERGEEGGLVLVRLVIGARMIGGEKAGENDGFTVIAVALIWSSDEATATSRFIIVIKQGRFPRKHD